MFREPSTFICNSFENRHYTDFKPVLGWSKNQMGITIFFTGYVILLQTFLYQRL